MISALQNFFANVSKYEYIAVRIITTIIITTMYTLRRLSSVHFNKCALLFAKCFMLVYDKVGDFKKDPTQDEVHLPL
jgi:hypothetical protein